jgi:hypothetical protein
VDYSLPPPEGVVDPLLWRSAQPVLARHPVMPAGEPCPGCGGISPCVPRWLAERAVSVARAEPKDKSHEPDKAQDGAHERARETADGAAPAEAGDGSGAEIVAARGPGVDRASNLTAVEAGPADPSTVPLPRIGVPARGRRPSPRPRRPITA